MPLLADCKNIKHINSFCSRIKRVNEPNEKVKAALFSLSHGSMQLGAIKYSLYGPPTILCGGASDLGSSLFFSLFPTAILLEKGIIK